MIIIRLITKIFSSRLYWILFIILNLFVFGISYLLSGDIQGIVVSLLLICYGWYVIFFRLPALEKLKDEETHDA